MSLTRPYIRAADAAHARINVVAPVVLINVCAGLRVSILPRSNLCPSQPGTSSKSGVPSGRFMSGSLCVWGFSIPRPSQRISAESAEPCGLVILAGSNPLPLPQCSSPSRRPDSHAATVVAVVRKLER